MTFLSPVFIKVNNNILSKMRAKRIQLLLLTFAISLSVKAQIPPSPDASALAEYANTSVNLFTGALKISVPIWDINFRGINMPISLTYNPSGIKVETIASRVGLGWSLNAGGLITRVVMGLPDDFYDIDSDKRGFLASDIAKQVNELDLTATESDLLSNVNRLTSDDSEPDMFYFNFNGITGKFVFDGKKEIKLMPYQNIKLDYTLDAKGQISSFLAITEDGVQFIFDKVDITEIDRTAGFTDIFFPSVTKLKYNSSWYLSKVISVNGEIINLGYEPEIIEYILPTKQLGYLNYEYYLDDYSHYVVLSNKFKLNGWRLSQIYSNTFQIDFLYNGIQRQDLPGSFYLNTIKISSVPLNLIKVYNLDYSYFTSPNATSSLFYRLKLNSIQETNGSLSKPPTVFKYNDNGVSLPNRMSCEQDLWGYYNANQATTLFPKLYIYPDLIGNDRFRVYPKSNYNGTSYTLDQGADRLPNETTMQYNVLNEIDYPTGGYTKYTYESNDFYYGGENLKGCGIRVSKTEQSDGVNITNNIITNYSYKDISDETKSSGRLFHMPSFAELTNSLYWDDNMSKYIDLSDINFNYSSIDYYKKFLYYSSIDLSKISASLGENFGYKSVTVGVDGHGKSVYTFSTPGGCGQDNDCFNTADPSCTCNSNEVGYCDGLFHSFKKYYLKSGNFTVYLDNLSTVYDGIPFVYGWNRGLLMSRKDYDYQNNPIKEINNTYNVFFRNGISPEYAFGLESDCFVPILRADRDGANNYVCTFGKYFYLTGTAKVLQSSTETIYDSNNSNKSVSTTTTYDYNTFGQVSSISQTQSDGSVSINKRKYIADLTLTNYCILQRSTCRAETWQAYENCINAGHDRIECSDLRIQANEQCDIDYDNCIQNFPNDYKVISKMQSKNMISNLIEEQGLKQNGSEIKLVSGSLIHYKDFGGDILKPYAQYTLEQKNPSSDLSQASLNSSGSFIYHPNYKSSVILDSYDDKGNLRELHEVNGINTSYIWGYNKTQPIAEVKNATSNEIYYTGFEESTPLQVWLPYTLDNTFSKTGRASFKTVNTQSVEWVYFTPFLDINNTTPKKYKYSCWVYSSGPSAQLFLFMKPNTDNEFYSTGWTADSRSTSETGKWVFLEGEVTVPINMKRLYLRMDNNSNGTVWFDDLKLRPSDSQMTTYTYDPLIGITSVTDSNNKTTTYQYDDFGRLVNVLDENGYIINHYEYKYGQ